MTIKINNLAYMVSAVALAGVVFLSPRASVAQSCADAATAGNYSYSDACGSSGNTSGSTVTSSSTVAAAAVQTANLVMGRLTSFRASASGKKARLNDSTGTVGLLGFGTGKSAGGSAERLGLWVNGSYNRSVGGISGADFDTKAWSVMVGGDFRVTDRFLLGLGLGYEDMDGDTGFNRGTIESKGMTVAPYATVSINDNVSVDVLLGYTHVEYDLTRIQIQPAGVADVGVTAEHDGERYFGGVTFNGDVEKDNLTASVSLGTLFVAERQDSYTDSFTTSNKSRTITVGTVKVGARVGYRIKMVQPYLSANYGYDYNDAGGTYDGRDAYSGAVGINVNLGNFTANIEGTASYKDHVKSAGGSLNLRYQLKF